MRTLPFTEELALPLDAATQTFGDLGKKGGGKTYGAQRRFELLYDAGVQCVAFDPVGNWWGLRLLRDGKMPGLPVPVFGGAKGDIPLETTAGAYVAQVIVERDISVVLDVSRFRKGERKRFLTDFAEEFFHLKKDAASPVHLFLDEAHFFVPQRPQKGEERMLGAMEDIVRVGRNYGIGVTLISQRAASVNKDVLTQVECLLAYQTSSAQDKKAIREWVEENDEAGLALLGELKGLAQGEALLWSPSWLRVFRKVHVTQKDTYDASSTPKVGAAPRKVRELAPVDLEEIRDAMQESIERQRDNDPAELRRCLKATQDKLDVALLKGLQSATPKEVPVIAEEDLARLERAVSKLGEIRNQTAQAEQVIATELENFRTVLHKTLVRKATPAPSKEAPALVEKKRRAPSTDAPKLGTGPRAMLRFLSMNNPRGLTRTQLALLVGIKATGSAFSNYLSILRVAGLVQVEGAIVHVTDEGLHVVDDVVPVPQTTDAMVAMWKSRLKSGGARAILDKLVVSYPGSVTRAALAEHLGIAMGGSALANYLSLLRTNGLLQNAGSSAVVASSDLFPT